MKRKQEVQDFAISFAKNVIAKDDEHRNKLAKEINEIFDYSEIDDVVDWDNGTEYEWYGKTCYNHGMGGMLDDIFSSEYYFDDEDEDADEEGYVDLTNGTYNNVCCAIRIAIDLFINPSGGVLGYNVGDLQKAFGGNIPDWVSKLFTPDLDGADPKAGIWL